MRYGIRLPHYLTDGSPERVAATAREAERLGFDSVWVVDHLLIPADPERSWGWSYYDPFVTLGQVAAITERVRLGTSVIVLPYRPPVVSAKLVAALDQVSDGRLILGVGAGALIEEFEALGPTRRWRSGGPCSPRTWRSTRGAGPDSGTSSSSRSRSSGRPRRSGSGATARPPSAARSASATPGTRWRCASIGWKRPSPTCNPA